jgi:phage-related holin
MHLHQVPTSKLNFWLDNFQLSSLNVFVGSSKTFNTLHVIVLHQKSPPLLLFFTFELRTLLLFFCATKLIKNWHAISKISRPLPLLLLKIHRSGFDFIGFE